MFQYLFVYLQSIRRSVLGVMRRKAKNLLITLKPSSEGFFAK